MAAQVESIPEVKLPAKPSSLTPEQTYWRTFKSSLNLSSPTNHAVTHIAQPSPSLNPLQTFPETFAVTTGARIQIFSHRTRKLLKTITRFDDVAHSGEIRYDGRVLVAGDDTGAIQVFDINSRAILKTWKECKQPVWTTKWSPENSTSLMSCCDDNTVRLWDLPSETNVFTFHGHQDYVRTGAFMSGRANNLLVSGSYDQTIRLWDSRAPGPALMTFKHAAPVESILCMPSGTTVAAAAGNQIAILDIVAGRPLHIIKNHQKTVTSLAFASNGSRLVSGGLDGHMKIFETTGWNVVAGSKYPAPILSLSIINSGGSTDDKHIAVGMSSGLLRIKTRLSGVQKVKERERQKEMEALLAGTIEDHDKKMARNRPSGWQKRLRGRDYDGEGADIIIAGNDREKVKKRKLWDKELHNGRYREALDSVIETQDKKTIFKLLSSLRYRSALRASLEDRDEATLKPITHWVWQNISDPECVPLCVELSMNILDLYSKFLLQSGELAKWVQKLRVTVEKQIEFAQQAVMLKGMLQLLFPEIISDE